MLYFTSEVFCRLANPNRGHIRVMLEVKLDIIKTKVIQSAVYFFS